MLQSLHSPAVYLNPVRVDNSQREIPFDLPDSGDQGGWHPNINGNMIIGNTVLGWSPHLG